MDIEYTEKEILEIMARFKVSREDAMYAPFGVLTLLPDPRLPMPPLSKADTARSLELLNDMQEHPEKYRPYND